MRLCFERVNWVPGKILYQKWGLGWIDLNCCGLFLKIFQANFCQELPGIARLALGSRDALGGLELLSCSMTLAFFLLQGLNINEVTSIYFNLLQNIFGEVFLPPTSVWLQNLLSVWTHPLYRPANMKQDFRLYMYVFICLQKIEILIVFSSLLYYLSKDIYLPYGEET